MTEFYDYFSTKEYISIQKKRSIEQKFHPHYKKIRRNIFYIFSKSKRKFVMDYRSTDKLVETNNNAYFNYMLDKHSDLFSSINGYQLDNEQSIAVLTEEKNVLLIAGAGSGKTLTIVGKIRYLIEIKLVEEKDILCISFTNASVDSLKKSLKKNYDYDVDVLTFHKLSLNILNRLNLNIADSNILDFIIDEFFDHIIFDYPKLMKIVLEYFDSHSSDYEKIKSKKSFISFKRLISQFIRLFKANVYNEDILYGYVKKVRGKDLCLLRCILVIYNIYNDELDSQNEIDFDDMIVRAINEIKEYGCKKYKYIIIDEYQDTSLIRSNLIQEIIKFSNANFMAVGDDFQSIYKFAGSNLEVFLDFKKYFNDCKILFINNTYRNCQELISVAGSFVMKNNKQIKKTLRSNSSLKLPIKIIYYDNLKESFKKLISIFKKDNAPVLVLGRNNNDIFKAVDDDFIYNNSTLHLDDYCFTYLTVHRSKGLEEENVILINLEDTVTGFPNKIEDNDILDLIIPSKNFIPYEEERRLFYVAITRTKNYNYLLVPRKKQSLFIRELLRDYRNHIEVIDID